MSYLKFYADENERHPDLRGELLDQATIEIGIRKFTRHYFGNYDGSFIIHSGNGVLSKNPARPIKLRFEAYSTGHAHGGGLIDFPPKRTDWLLVIHEFAHVYEVRKYGSTHHRKRMARVVDRIAAYVRGASWFLAWVEEKFAAWCKDEEETIRIEGHYTVTPEAPPLEVLPAKGLPAGLLTAAENKFFTAQYEPVMPVDYSKVKIAACPVPVDPDALADAEHELNREVKRAALVKKIAKREAQIKRLERRIKSLTTRAKKASRSLKALSRSLAKLEHP